MSFKQGIYTASISSTSSWTTAITPSSSRTPSLSSAMSACKGQTVYWAQKVTEYVHSLGSHERDNICHACVLRSQQKFQHMCNLPDVQLELPMHLNPVFPVICMADQVGFHRRVIINVFNSIHVCLLYTGHWAATV